MSDPEIPNTRQSPSSGRVSLWLRRLLTGLIRAYQATSAVRPGVCRYYPSCSEYTAQCILKHGVYAGVALGIRRILRCNPLSPGGYDPIP